jgi:hypothetical protein
MLGKLKLQAGLVLVAAAISFGCGSDSNNGSGSCTSVKGCGGDVTGTWTISGFCLQPSDTNSTQACGTVNIHASAGTATGTVTFNSDGTQSQNISVVADETALFPTSCVNSAAACTQAEAATNAQAGASNAHCSFSSAGCSCAFKVTQSISNSGTYRISGTSLTFQNTGESPETDPFCVSGNKLTLQTSDGDGNLAVVTATK